uniref:Anosmin 1b n=1 Tax=Neogobius melanostomus TaxID=47308 RepID=A0A8C6UTT2_9GOBI
MSLRGVALLRLCALVSVAVARRTSPEHEDVQDKINSARCTSRCLTLHMTQLTAAFRHVQSDHVLDWCENHRRCAQCLQPCKELWETRKVLSPKSCETECVTSREFVASLRTSRQGDCPPPQKASGFAAACVESCSSDLCGYTCQLPANLYKGVPLKPRREMSFVEDLEGRVRVLWMSKFNVSVEPVVYILQSRWNSGIHPSEDHASPWTTVSMTLSEDVLLSDLRSQRWYQFRVAAVNSQGSRGFTTPSKHYISNKDPSPPEPPQNIRVDNQTVDAATVGVLIRWDAPREGDLPVHNYRVTWRPQQIQPPLRRTQHGHTNAQCELWLQGLQPATSYFLSVQTVAYWGQKRLKSPRAQVGFTTVSHTGKQSERNSFIVVYSLRLKVASPHYHDDQLQVKVFWKWPYHCESKQRHPGPYVLRWVPHACAHNVTAEERTATVQGTHHIITGLLFACKYRVAVAMQSDTASEAVAWVTTPSCSSIRLREGKTLACNPEEHHLVGKKVILRPERLTADFEQVNGTLQATFRWRMSQQALEPSTVEGFQFTWTLQSQVTATSKEDTLISQTQTIAPFQRSVVVSRLQPDSDYQLKLQMLTTGGSTGAAVSKTIHTPALHALL